MESVSFFPYFLSLIFVLGLIMGVAWLMARSGFTTGTWFKSLNAGKNRRLEILETMPLDARRRVVIFRRDDKEHVLIIGATSEHILESDIKNPNQVTPNAGIDKN